MANRKKPAPIMMISNLAQASAVLAELSALTRKTEAIEAEMNERIAEQKERAAAAAAPCQDRIKALENGLQAFAEHRREELFANRKTVEVNGGRFGFRRSTRLKPAPKTTWAKVLNALKAAGIREAIRVKEAVNREELATWGDDKLEIYGVRREVTDVFWWEPADVELKSEAG